MASINLRHKGVVGLKNYGNTCFFNAACQILLSSNNFRQEILSLVTKDSDNSHTSVTYNYKNLLAGDDRGCDTPCLNLWKCITYKYPKYEGGQQHDSHECLINILETLGEETKRSNSRKSRTISFTDKNYNEILKDSANKFWDDDLGNMQKLVKQFYGQYRSVTRCSKCLRERNQWNVFNGLSIWTNNTNVPEYLKNSKSEEVIHGYDCDNCKEPTQATKIFEIWRMPKVIIFQVIQKSLTQVNVNLKYKEKSYTLNGICFHSGIDFDSGHYYSAIKRDNDWYFINDELTWGPVDIKSVLPSKIEEIYLLVYERVVS